MSHYLGCPACADAVASGGFSCLAHSEYATAPHTPAPAVMFSGPALESLIAERDQLTARCEALVAELADLKRPENRGIGDGDIVALFNERDALRAEVERLKIDLADIKADLTEDEAQRLAGMENQNAVIDEYRAEVYRYRCALVDARDMLDAALADPT